MTQRSLAICLAAVAVFAAVMALPAGEALAKDGAEGGHSFISFFSIFVMAIFVGYYVAVSYTHLTLPTKA